jgi:hypothetical protein
MGRSGRRAAAAWALLALALACAGLAAGSAAADAAPTLSLDLAPGTALVAGPITFVATPAGDTSATGTIGLIVDGLADPTVSFSPSAGTPVQLTHSFAAGTHTVQAQYRAGGTPVRSQTLTLTVTSGQVPAVDTTTTLAVAQSGSDATVTLSATVTSATGAMPFGQVEFLDGLTVLQVITLQNGVAPLTLGLTPGDHTLRAHFIGNAAFNYSWSDAAPTVHVSGQPVPFTTTTTLTAGTIDPDTGAVDLTAHVVQPAGTPPPVNTASFVTFYLGDPVTGQNLGQQPLDANGDATLHTSLTPGTHVLSASYAGFQNTDGQAYSFSSAPPLTVHVPVPSNATTLTVTAPTASMQYGGPVPTIGSPTLEPNLAGVASSCTTTASSTSHVGTYPITCQVVASSYNVVYVPGVLTVTPAPLTIVAPSTTTTYGGALPIPFAATVTGVLNNDTITPICATAAGPTSHPGTYPVTCTATAPDYAIATVDGAVTIGKAPLTVTANNVTVTAGQPIPTIFDTALTGFVNGQTLATSDVAGTASCTTTATASSPSGSYPITCSLGSLVSTNYDFAAFNAATLTIAPARPPVVCARPVADEDSGESHDRGKGSICENLLSEPSHGSRAKVGLGQTLPMSIKYGDETPLILTGPLAVSVILGDSTSLPVQVTVKKQDSKHYQSLIAFTVPSTLATGVYPILITVHDSDGHLDQWIWQLTVGKPTGHGDK